MGGVLKMAHPDFAVGSMYPHNNLCKKPQALGFLNIILSFCSGCDTLVRCHAPLAARYQQMWCPLPAQKSHRELNRIESCQIHLKSLFPLGCLPLFLPVAAAKKKLSMLIRLRLCQSLHTRNINSITGQGISPAAAPTQASVIKEGLPC